MNNKLNIKFMITVLMALLWGVAVNHCFIEFVLALDSNLVHHQGSNPHPQCESCDGRLAILRSSPISAEPIVSPGEHYFALASLFTLLLQERHEVLSYIVTDQELTSVRLLPASVLLSAPNAPPRSI